MALGTSLDTSREADHVFLFKRQNAAREDKIDEVDILARVCCSTFAYEAYQA
jgi:hypothetical protein